MAVDFNATTSKLEHTTANLDITSVGYTICAAVLADTAGEASGGRVISLDEGGNAMALRHAAGANVLELVHNATTGFTVWSFPASDSVWKNIGVSLSLTALANDPVARVDFANVTVTDVSSTSTGSFLVPTTGYCIGNRNDQIRTWDGMIQAVQVFNVILTPGEMDQACRRPGSVRRGLKLWLPILHAGHLVDWSGNGFNGTATALTNRVGGPSIASLYTGGQFTLVGDVANQRLLYMGVG